MNDSEFPNHLQNFLEASLLRKQEGDILISLLQEKLRVKEVFPNITTLNMKVEIKGRLSENSINVLFRSQLCNLTNLHRRQ